MTKIQYQTEMDKLQSLREEKLRAANNDDLYSILELRVTQRKIDELRHEYYSSFFK